MIRKLTNGALTVVAVIVVIAQIWLKQVEDALSRMEARRRKRKLVRTNVPESEVIRQHYSVEEGQRVVEAAHQERKRQEQYRWN